MKLKVTIVYCIIVFFSFIDSSIANDSSNSILDFEKFKIDSNQLLIFKEEKKVIFKGDVIADFKDSKLYTEIVEVYFRDVNGENKINKVIIPVKLKVIKECENEMIKSDKGTYDANSGMLELYGNVILIRKNNIVRTNKLIYSTIAD